MTTYSETEHSRRRLVSRSGFWQWQHEGHPSALKPPSWNTGRVSPVLDTWEAENRGPMIRFAFGLLHGLRRYFVALVAVALSFVFGAALGSGPTSTAANVQLRDRLRQTEARLSARQGELALVRMEIGRLGSIMDNSQRYRIPADLSAIIYDVALSEGIDPRIAFALVSVESDFLRKAVSNKGAVGLTQMMPATARILDPSLDYTDLFDRETNLRLGFRFLREMLTYYNGDLSLALTAYNRGPTRVDEIRRAGGNPSNGYAQSVLNGGQRP